MASDTAADRDRVEQMLAQRTMFDSRVLWRLLDQEREEADADD